MVRPKPVRRTAKERNGERRPRPACLAEPVVAHRDRVARVGESTHWPSIGHLAAVPAALNVTVDWVGGAPQPQQPPANAGSLRVAKELAASAPPLEQLTGLARRGAKP
jgi:hypothetical protein